MLDCRDSRADLRGERHRVVIGACRPMPACRHLGQATAERPAGRCRPHTRPGRDGYTDGTAVFSGIVLGLGARVRRVHHRCRRRWGRLVGRGGCRSRRGASALPCRLTMASRRSSPALVLSSRSPATSRRPASTRRGHLPPQRVQPPQVPGHLPVHIALLSPRSCDRAGRARLSARHRFLSELADALAGSSFATEAAAPVEANAYLAGGVARTTTATRMPPARPERTESRDDGSPSTVRSGTRKVEWWTRHWKMHVDARHRVCGLFPKGVCTPLEARSRGTLACGDAGDLTLPSSAVTLLSRLGGQGHAGPGLLGPAT